MRRAAAVAVAALLLMATATVPLPVSAHTNDVRVDPQVSTDGTVVVETVFIADDGWLVLHADDNGSLGEPIGHTAVSDEGGLNEDVPVAVEEDRWADWQGDRVHAALHRDDGDGQFEPGEDEVLTSFGNPATGDFTLEKGDAALVTAREFGPQKTANRTLTVRQVRLPSDGHLVALNTTEVEEFTYEPVAPVGSTALAAGRHDNVTVRLNRSFYRSTPEQFRVAFAVYRDDGDGEFDADDEPVTAAGDGVDTVIAVERTESTGTATPTATPADGGGTGDATPTDTGDATPTPGDGDGSTSDTPTGTAVATPTPTPEDDGSIVVTASPTPTPTPTPSPAGTDTGSGDGGGSDGSDDGDGDSGEGTDADGTTGTAGTSGGSGPGFGVGAVVAAMAAAVALVAARRATDGPDTE